MALILGVTPGTLLWSLAWLALGLAFVGLAVWRRHRRQSPDDAALGLFCCLMGLAVAFADWLTGRPRPPSDDVVDGR